MYNVSAGDIIDVISKTTALFTGFILGNQNKENIHLLQAELRLK